MDLPLAIFLLLLGSLAVASLPWIGGRRALPWTMAILVLASSSFFVLLYPIAAGAWGDLLFVLYAAAPLTIFLTYVRLWDDGRWADFGLALPPGQVGKLLGLSGGLVGIYALLTLEPGLDLGFQVTGQPTVTTFVLLFLTTPLLVLGQEAIFRGYLLTKLSNRFPLSQSLPISAGLFSFYGVNFFALPGSATETLAKTIFTTVLLGFAVGIVVGLYYYRSGWNLFGPWTFRTGFVWFSLLSPVLVARLSWEFTFIFSLIGLASVLVVSSLLLREPRYRARHDLGASTTPRRRTLVLRARARRQLALAAVLVVVLGVLVGVAGPVTSSSSSVPLRILTIASGSMVPTLHVGDVVLITHVTSPADVHVGELVAYNAPYLSPEGPVVHRVISIHTNQTGTWYRFKGDANPAPDPRPARFEQIDGSVVASVPWIGYLVLFPPFGIGLVALLALLAGYRASSEGAARHPRRPTLPVRRGWR